MTFCSAYNRPAVIPCPPGEDEVKEFALSYDENRVPGLIQTGKHSMKDYIQSFAEETDLLRLIQKCVQTGDFSFLQASPGVYGDTTVFPGNLIDSYNQVLQAEKFYNSLPADKLKAYDGFADFLEKVSGDPAQLSQIFAKKSEKPAEPVPAAVQKEGEAQ